MPSGRSTVAVPSDWGETSTPERLLMAAERSFADHGFAATSVRTITAAADCNVAAVNYHFGGKRGLYEALFSSRLALLRKQRVDSVRQAMTRPGRPATVETLLRVFASAFLEPLVAEGRGRHLLSLLSRELLDPHLPAEQFEREMVGPVRRVLSDALLALTPGLTSEQASRCVTSIVGQLVQVAHRRRWETAAEGRTRRGPRLPEMVEHIVRFSAAGVRACARGGQ
jgi:AcrR family transcriptional regulator